MAKKIKVRILKKIDEVYSEKQRRYMCAMSKQGADRPDGLSKAEAEEMCKDTEHSKLDEEWSKSERNKRKSKCDNPKGFTMKQFCKNQRTKSKKGEKKNEEMELEERCQKGYKTHPKRKTKVMFGKTYRNCVKAEEGKDPKVKARLKKSI